MISGDMKKLLIAAAAGVIAALVSTILIIKLDLPARLRE